MARNLKQETPSGVTVFTSSAHLLLELQATAHFWRLYVKWTVTKQEEVAGISYDVSVKVNPNVIRICKWVRKLNVSKLN